MTIGQSIKEMRDREGLTQEQLTMKLPLSQQLISHVETGRRKLQKDAAHTILKEIDDPYSALDINREFSAGQTAPRINGDSIEFDNRLAVMVNAIKETKEALGELNLERFIKPPDMADDRDIRAAETTYKECLEGCWALNNLCATLAYSYALPTKKLNEELTRKWKTTEVIK